ncbi:hypothetical protein Hanom_Chr05g00396111 [Helianthus anomalus]
MDVELPPLKWSRATFDGNFRLLATKFFLEILDFYKFHISQMHPIGMVTVRHFEFVCRTMHIELKVPRFRCRRRRFCFNPQNHSITGSKKSFFIKVGVIPMRMTFRGKEDVPTETVQTPVDKNWYKDLKDVPSIALPQKALVCASMSLNWRMNREDKPVYMEGDKVVSLYVVAFEREGGKMATIAKKSDEELWYHRIVRNFVLSWDDDLSAQPVTCAGELSNLGIGPEKKKRAPTTTVAPKKSDAEKAQPSMVENVGGEKKGMRCSSDFWCDYVVVSDSLESLTPAIIRRPKAEPKDIVDIPLSNPGCLHFRTCSW